MATVKLLDPTDPKNKLDRYELIGEIAAGGMAVVYLARIAGLGGFQRFVAIKRLHAHLAHEEEFVEMFLDEGRLAASIHNPHVVPILEVGDSEQGIYLVMEYIEGDTLSRVASRAAGRVTGLQPAAAPGEPPKRPKRATASMPSNGPALPRPVTVRILLDSLAGLHAAHEHTDPHGNPLHIVHRDISPQNILVGVDGSARITDFGVARAATRLSTTRSDTVKGKLAYLSPEQARGEGIDRRSDIFAMGIILWELLTGGRLFRGETDRETIARVTNGPIPPPSNVVPGLHPAFDAVVLRALARDVSQRFNTCAEMADALERAALEAAAAGAGGGVAQPRDVAAFMNDVLGQQLAQQRESVRVWLAQRNDPGLAASRPPPPAQRVLVATGRQAIVAPLPAPAMPAGMAAAAAAQSAAANAAALAPPAVPIVTVPNPEDDGDPTTLRVRSSMTNSIVAVQGEDTEVIRPKSNKARVAAVVIGAALLAVLVVVVLKSGDRGATAGPSETPTASATSAQTVSQTAAAVTAQPTQPAEPSIPAPTGQPTQAASADEPSVADTPPEDTPKPGKKWKPPTKATTSATASTPPASTPTATATKPPPKGDDLSNPYK
ncbi:MAG: protein kinase [Polyangiaceae bacterium]|nr:protein kinase [Polyangiaceae bacterium]